MTRLILSRKEVYALIDGERDYQHERWNESTTSSNGDHTWEEWIVYIEDYLSDAKHILSRESKSKCDPIVGEVMRKVAALAVASLENNGSTPRKKSDASPPVKL